MNETRNMEELAARFLADEATAGEKQTLRDACLADPIVLDELAAGLAVERLLKFNGVAADKKTFAAEVSKRLQTTGGETTWNRRVIERLNGKMPANTTTLPKKQASPFFFRLVVPLAAAAALMLGVYGVNVWQAKQSEKAVMGYVREARGNVARIHESQNRIQNSEFRIQNNAGENEETGRPLRIGEIIGIGDAVQVGADGYVKFAYPDGSEIELSRNTQMALGASRETRLFGLVQVCRGKWLKLDAGRLVAQVARQPAGQPMILTTPHAKVTVVGTSFSLEESADQTQLHVQEGTVRVAELTGGKEIEVSGGYSAAAGPGMELKAVRTPGEPMGLVAYWKFDETSGTTASDSSGNGNTGTLQNGPVWTTGVIGGALSLDGEHDYVSTTIGQSGPNTFTASLWFKTTTTSGGRLIGFGDRQTGSSENFDRHLYMNHAGQIYFGCCPGGGDANVHALTTTAACNDGAWHHVAATLSSAGMALYMDGVLCASNPAVTSAQAFTGYWKIGYDNLTGWPGAPNSYYFKGCLDDVRVYNCALTAAEIATLAATGTNSVQGVLR